MKKAIKEMWRDDREGLIGGILIIPAIYVMTWLVSFLDYVFS